jgi:glutamine synthetase
MHYMQDSKKVLNPNKLVQYLDKMPADFTKQDIIRFIEGNNIQMVNFRYVAADGKLKNLSFAITSKEQLDRVLSAGERVDGSSLFPYIDAASSDLYVIPRYRTAYVNPFAQIPTLDILCSYYNNLGDPLESAPEYTLRKAHQTLKDKTGLTMEAMGELEYYVIYEKKPLYTGMAQKGYHEAAPFMKWGFLRNEAMLYFAQAGGKLKYGHAEVGNIPDQEFGMEQYELELQPVPLEEAAEQVILAKWFLRMVGYKYGVNVSFAPKVIVGHAGSGLHVHMRLKKDGKSVMIENGKISDTARKAIAGVLELAPSLTAFANTNPLSYLRLVPHQEAPTNVCWGDRNRSVLVRVPLGWVNVKDMARNANPNEPASTGADLSENQTFEFRVPDGSADIYLTMAGLAVAARQGLENPQALDIAKKYYVDVNIFKDEYKHIQESLPQLPASCWSSADHLLQDRAAYEKEGVFSKVLIDGIASKLKSYEDKDLSERLYGHNDQIKELVKKFMHCA